MNAGKLKKKRVFQVPFNFKFRRKKLIALKLFEFLKQFMMDTFLLKLTQFEKAGSKRKISFRWEI